MATEGDLILIYHQDRPTIFARVEHIEPDIKKDWYHITLLLLTIPTRTVTWILRGAYIEGGEFTMGEKPMRLEPVEKAMIREDSQTPGQANEKKGPNKPGTVIPFKRP